MITPQETSTTFLRTLNLVEIEERFWSKVDRDLGDTSRCWEWRACVDKGYGQFWLKGSRVLAHRFSYELSGLVIPKGLQLDHLCRNRRCVNPHHLEPVSQKENIYRGEGPTATNSRKTRCPKGHEYDVQEVEVSGTVRRRCSVCLKENSRNRSRRYLARKKASHTQEVGNA